MTLHVDVACRLSPAFDLEVSRTFEPGFTILFGTSGSGKTTLLRAIAGLVRPDRGHIGVHDRVLFDSARRVFVPAPDRRVGYVFQHLALFPHLTVRANIEYGLARMTASEREGRVAAIAGSFGIAHLLDRRPRAISGGERQRVALARSLVTDPELLLLDEPLSALDLPTQSRIIADLRRWNEAHGIPILYVTHAHREAFTLGERAVVLEHGRVIADGVPHQVLDQPGRESLALLAGFENIFDAVVTATHPASGVMECRVDRAGFDIEVPCAPVSAGDTVRLAVRAGDILVATEPPRGLSARNQLPGRIEVLRREGGIMVAHVDVGRVFVVHLTPGAAGSLSLQPGQTIWLVIKTHSFRWLTVS